MFEEIKKQYRKGLITYGELLVKFGEIYNAECEKHHETNETPFQGSKKEKEIVEAFNL